MVFSSVLFLLIFLPLFYLGYSLLAPKWRNYWILGGSIIFYAWGAPIFIFILLASTIVDFYLVAKMYKENDRKRKRQLLILSIILNLGLLVYFKYSNFFIDNVNVVLESMGFSLIEWTNVLLPIGISFYTFQTLTYSIDIYRGINKPLEKLSDYLLYILSFPQMIAGPIVRFSSIKDEILGRKEYVDDKLIGLTRFAIGLSKKVFIANVLGKKADIIFNYNVEDLSTPTAWLGIVAYTFQIYFDFSGYSDMAIGLGRMMGFTFPENFNSPYISKSITEFWRRWHITLGDWMRDYLYIPLGGNRVNSNFRLYANLITVFLISGLWHGASWNFMLWGAFHGTFLILDRLFLAKLLKKTTAFFSIPFTFFLAMMGWVVFRIEDFDDALVFYEKLFAFQGEYYLITNQQMMMLIIAILGSFVALIPWVSEKSDEFVHWRKIDSWKSVLFLFLGFVVLILSISQVVSSNFNPFIYFRF